ncbi:MAG TPA: hypothetical protein VI911_12220 [Patescibacteria group bacterium]|nr:hypothetical protein [Patescibacteria group bacterium]
MKLTGNETIDELKKLIGRLCFYNGYCGVIRSIGVKQGANNILYRTLVFDGGQYLLNDGTEREVAIYCIGDHFVAPAGRYRVVDIRYKDNVGLIYDVLPCFGGYSHTCATESQLLYYSRAVSTNIEPTCSCSHPNKREVHLITSKYLYCPDCKQDLGDVK